MNLETFNPIEYISESLAVIESSATSVENSKENLTCEDIESLEIVPDESVFEGSELEHFAQIEKEIIYDCETIGQITSYLESFDSIRYENWAKMSSDEKLSVLREVEDNLADIERRPAMNVVADKMGSGTLGYHDSSSNMICINEDVLISDKPEAHRKILDTLIHEGRHAYQHYNVDVQLIHESGVEVECWRENFYDSKYQYYQYAGQEIRIPDSNAFTDTSDFRLYYNQPIEVDARDFTSQIIDQLESKGLVAQHVS